MRKRPGNYLVSITAALLSVCLLAACSNSPIDQQAVSSKQGYSDVDGIKIAAGQVAPDFTLKDIAGKPVQLSAFRGKSNVMLLFYRGQWCPFCIGHLEDIQSLFPDLPNYNTILLAISPDDRDDLQKMADRFDVPYTFLSDADLAVAERYGIRRDESLPHPAVILINRQGEVVWFYVGENYRQRPSASQIREVLDRVFRKVAVSD